MRIKLGHWLWFICLWAAALAAPGSASAPVVVLNVQGAIGPGVSDYLHRAMEQAQTSGAELIVLRMDTPGGLDAAMRDIIRDIIASPVPVATFVAPGGARAASAGTYILYASHIAAMAPGTNLGAATPVQIGGVPTPAEPGTQKPPQDADKEKDGEGASDQAGAMEKKIVNDAVAYIRGLAQMRGRNADWAEQAVRAAASLPAEEALKQKVIDLVATDVRDLLAQLDGRTVNVLGQEQTLKTAASEVQTIEPDWRSELLAVLSDPNIAYILMLIGIYGLFFEFANPGYILPGVVGAICLLLALFAFQVLPVNYAGLGLMLLGIAFMVGEVFVPSFGALGIGGVVAFVIGSIILFDTDAPGYGISVPLIVSVALVSALFFMGVVGMAVRARGRPVVSGREELIGSIGEVVEGFTGEGRVRVHGEIWSARCGAPLAAGVKVAVTGREGLTLLVEPQTEEH